LAEVSDVALLRPIGPQQTAREATSHSDAKNAFREEFDKWLEWVIHPRRSGPT